MPTLSKSNPQRETVVAPWGPPFQKGETHFFMGINRNKRNLILDLKTAPGQEVARTIARRCDVLVQNMRPGVAERYGLGYDTLRTRIPPHLPDQHGLWQPWTAERHAGF